MSVTTVALFVAVGLVQGADEPAKPAAAPRSAAPAEKAEGSRQRVREGSRLLEQQGSFVPAGDRYLFVAADQSRFMVLENLALQRIALALSEPQTAPTWTVTGIVTEFRGANYLLVTRAVMSSDKAK
jgi:hypothetical protein